MIQDRNEKAKKEILTSNGSEASRRLFLQGLTDELLLESVERKLARVHLVGQSAATYLQMARNDLVGSYLRVTVKIEDLGSSEGRAPRP